MLRSYEIMDHRGFVTFDPYNNFEWLRLVEIQILPTVRKYPIFSEDQEMYVDTLLADPRSIWEWRSRADRNPSGDQADGGWQESQGPARRVARLARDPQLMSVAIAAELSKQAGCPGYVRDGLLALAAGHPTLEEFSICLGASPFGTSTRHPEELGPASEVDLYGALSNIALRYEVVAKGSCLKVTNLNELHS